VIIRGLLQLRIKNSIASMKQLEFRPFCRVRQIVIVVGQSRLFRLEKPMCQHHQILYIFLIHFGESVREAD